MTAPASPGGRASRAGGRSSRRLEEALGRVLRLPEPAPLTVAGRTDAGVHARGQVAHADVPAAYWAAARTRQRSAAGRDAAARSAGPPVSLPPAGLRRPVLRCVGATPTGSATIPAGPTRCGGTNPLVPAARSTSTGMNEAARALPGEHDFAAFCRRREGACTVRELLRLDGRGSPPALAWPTVVADAFCHNMVRALVGALLRAGDGRKPAGLAGAGARRRRA